MKITNTGYDKKGQSRYRRTFWQIQMLGRVWEKNNKEKKSSRGLRLYALCYIILIFFLLNGVYPIKQRDSGQSEAKSTLQCPRQVNETALTTDVEKHITLRVAGWSSSAEEDKLVQESIRTFESVHPNITVHWTAITGEYTTNIAALLRSKDPPDVFYLKPAMATDYIPEGKLLDLSPYMGRDHIQARDYMPAFLTPFTCQNGHIYGIPKDWNTLGIYYNKELFREANVLFPRNDWTWDDMRTSAEKIAQLHRQPTIYGASLPATASRWLAFLYARDGLVLNDDHSIALFNNQAGIDALQFYTSFQTHDRSSAQPSEILTGAAWDGNGFDVFGQQRAAMVIEGGWLMQYLQKRYPSIDYGIAPMPVAPNHKRATLMFTNAWSASQHTTHPEAAWQFIQDMTNANTQKKILNTGFAFPTQQGLAHDQYFQEHPEAKILYNSVEYGYFDEFGKYNSFIHSKLDNAIDSVLAGQQKPAEALDTAAWQINQVLQR